MTAARDGSPPDRHKPVSAGIVRRASSPVINASANSPIFALIGWKCIKGMTTPFTLEAPATSNFNMTSDTEFGTLRLLALGWETKDRRLAPSFSKVLSTIAEVGLACGLAQPSHNPKNGFQFRMVEREELSDELIKQNSEKEGDE